VRLRGEVVVVGGGAQRGLTEPLYATETTTSATENSYKCHTATRRTPSISNTRHGVPRYQHNTASRDINTTLHLYTCYQLLLCHRFNRRLSMSINCRTRM